MKRKTSMARLSIGTISKMGHLPDNYDVREIPGWPRYSIDTVGVVRSRRKGREKALSGAPLPAGYITFTLCRGGKSKRVYAHRVVLETFVGPCPDGMECNHINRTRDDNRLENLEWVKISKNRTGSRGNNCGERNAHAKLTKEDVVLIREFYAAGAMRQYELAEIFGVCYQTIYYVINRRTWRHV